MSNEGATQAVQASNTNTQSNVETNTPTPQEDITTSQAEKLFKLKVLGSEKEFPESEILKYAQLGVASNEKFEEIARSRKEIDAVMQGLLNDPAKFMRGHPNKQAVLQIAQELLQEYVTEQESYNAMSESERRAVSLQKELDKRTQELDARDKAVQEHLQEHYRNQLQNEIISALDTTSLPKNERTVMRVATYYKQALDRGINVTMPDVAKLVEKEAREEYNTMFGKPKPQMRKEQLHKPNFTQKSKEKISKSDWYKSLGIDG